MKLDYINQILKDARFPAITEDEVAELDGADALAGFETHLLGLEAGAEGARGAVELLLRAVSKSTRNGLVEIGFSTTTKQLLAIVRKEGMTPFRALHAIRTGQPAREEALAYLGRLGLKKVVLPAKSGPAKRTDAPYYNFKIYSTGAALCISEARTRSTNEHTVQIEGANVLAGQGTNDRKFDWQRKIILQLDVQECYQLLAVLEGMVDKVKFVGHGNGHDKGMYLDDQGHRYFVRLVQPSRQTVALPVTPVDAARLASLLYVQLERNQPGLSMEALHLVLRRMVAMNSAVGA
jgi:hypothetical protein